MYWLWHCQGIRGAVLKELCLDIVQHLQESSANMDLASTCEAFKSENIWGQSRLESRLKSRLKYCPLYMKTFPHHFDPIPPSLANVGEVFTFGNLPPTPASSAHADTSNIFTRGDIFSDFQLFSPLFTVASLWSDDKMQIRKVARLKKSADIDS